MKMLDKRFKKVPVWRVSDIKRDFLIMGISFLCLIICILKMYLHT